MDNALRLLHTSATLEMGVQQVCFCLPAMKMYQAHKRTHNGTLTAATGPAEGKLRFQPKEGANVYHPASARYHSNPYRSCRGVFSPSLSPGYWRKTWQT